MDPTTATSVAHQRTERGASSVEYGFMVVAIAGLLVLLFFSLGTVTSDLFSGSCSAIDGQTQVAASC